jgi:hypothetical protein
MLKAYAFLISPCMLRTALLILLDFKLRKYLVENTNNETPQKTIFSIPLRLPTPSVQMFSSELFSRALSFPAHFLSLN